MEGLFAALTRAVENPGGLAFAAAFLWGIISIILSPCHLASLPLIIGFIGEQGRTSMRHAFWLSTLFATGILITLGVIGGITAALGSLLGQVGAGVNYAVAAVFLLVGLHLLGVIPLPLPGAGTPGLQRKGLLAALLLGLIFGIALGPCTFAFMAPILAVTFSVATTDALYALGLLLTFAVGHCAVIVAAGTSAELVQRYLNWTEASRGAVVLRQVCGVLVILGGLYMIYKA